MSHGVTWGHMGSHVSGYVGTWGHMLVVMWGHGVTC